MEHFGKEVRELKTSLKQMEKKIKAAPTDFKKQMDEFMEVIPSVFITVQDIQTYMCYRWLIVKYPS